MTKCCLRHSSFSSVSMRSEKDVIGMEPIISADNLKLSYMCLYNDNDWSQAPCATETDNACSTSPLNQNKYINGVHSLSLSANAEVHKGHFVVYVGDEMKRFVVPTSYLKNPIFQKLLDESAEEYGFDNKNGIVLPCDESTFRSLTAFLAS
ncbi:hypothetical protein SADUNF_Sadunf19G0087600 [Salix dunnii]|uniref:Uncharacterized protein n=1 Tax=Salix dunnii TaxID=1413687 RepID=A0A835J171_9ROSI|nr:hypothetical protein SADUNF_Sadunf19G0087600 [Salix dunnii]